MTTDDRLPKLTIRMLRDGDTGCARRLALAYENRSGSSGAKFRGRAESRVVEDARLAHTSMRIATEADFPSSTDLLPEEQALHRVAARAYLALFSDTPAESLDTDAWETVRADLGFRLVGPVGLVVTLPDATLEIRRLRFAPVRAPDETELRFLAARLGTSEVRVVTADLVNVDRHETMASIDPFENDEWMRARVKVITARGRDPQMTPECAYCEYIADCEAHR